MSEKKCYNCKWAIPGHQRWSGHFRGCNHPAVASMNDNGLQAVGIDAHLEAKEEGWFDWPFNFDPRWINECKGFEGI